MTDKQSVAPQVIDFRAECNALANCVADLPDAAWDTPTQFKGWTINDVFVHLHFWNRAADMSLNAPDDFMVMMGRVVTAIRDGGLRPIENREITERGPELFDLWRGFAHDMCNRWMDVDAKARVKWAGPDMSSRSSITARQMETWAHGFEIFDALGKTRADTDRIRNIVVLGVNTCGFAFRLNNLAPPEATPRLRLTSPSGEAWVFGDDDQNLITGTAVDFAGVVTQTRSIADTGLTTNGPVAEQWMKIAQCFAGAAEPPPAPGTRHVQAKGS